LVHSWFESLSCFSLHLLSSLLLVVLSLHVLKFSCESFDLILILIDLSLVHVQLSSHCLHLAGLFLQVLLIDGKLFSNLWAWLSSKKVFELNVKLLFLLDDNILLNDFFSFLDESLLKGLDLLEHLPSIWIGSLELSPSVAVEWIFKLFGQSLNLKSLSQQLSLEVVNIFLKSGI